VAGKRSADRSSAEKGRSHQMTVSSPTCLNKIGLHEISGKTLWVY
jgi:hypothetical protein